MRRLLAPLTLMLAVGCGSKAPTEKYFSGKPVAYWLEAARSPDARARKQAIDVLGNVGPADPAAIPALAAALKDKDARVREAAVLALSKIGPPAKDANAALAELRDKDPDPKVRRSAATALGQIQAGG
jgi:HEAT repeat protein